MTRIYLCAGPALYISHESITGRGVYAGEAIAGNSFIEYSLAWELSPDSVSAFEAIDEVGGYWFDHPHKEGWGLLPAGVAEILNHSDTPNCRLDWKCDREIGYIGEIWTLAAIEKDEQLRIHYGIPLPDGWMP